MGVVPQARAAKIEFCEGHVTTWNLNAVAMGSSVPTITAWQAKVVAARAALTAQTAAMGAAKTATLNFNLAIDALDAATAEVIQQVRLKAVTGGDAIYGLADIPAPATPTHRPTPGTPYKFEAILNPDGSVDMSWKCDNSGNSGTTYQVYRSVGGSTDYLCLGGSGQRKFTDDTIPAGVTQLTYKIQATRTTAVGLWATFNVFFGSNAGSTSIASIEAVPAKAAA